MPPVGETRVHERLEGGTMVVNLQVGQFVDDHILHEFARFEGELTGVGDLALREVADAPKGLHATELPCDARFV